MTEEQIEPQLSLLHSVKNMNRTDSDRPTKKEAEDGNEDALFAGPCPTVTPYMESKGADEIVEWYGGMSGSVITMGLAGEVFRSMWAARKWEIERMKSQK